MSTVNSLIKLNQWANVTRTQRFTAIYTIEEIEKAILDELTVLLPDDVLMRPSLILNHRLPEHCDITSLDLRLFIDCIQPLLVNAIRNASGGVVAVTITVSEDYRSMMVDIKDNGCGMKLEDQMRIFDIYEKVNRHTANVGLGLTLAQKLAALMDGHVSLVSSEIGKGSHFRTTFKDPTCASSLSPNRKEYANLPLAFNRLRAGNMTSLIGNSFMEYLTGRGFTESRSSSGSFSTLDFTDDLTQLYITSKQVGEGQVVICLVPEKDLILNIAEQPFIRDGNVIYSKGPFTTRTFEDILAEADAMFAEQAIVKTVQSIPSGDGTVLESIPPATSVCKGPENKFDLKASDLSHCGSSSSKALVVERLAKFVAPFNMNPKHSSPLLRSNKPMTLLVDDNTINLRFLQMYCNRRSIPYRTATDGAQAVELFVKHRAHAESMPAQDQQPPCFSTEVTTTEYSTACQPMIRPFQLVLMDLQMPVCDGIRATSRIRALEKEFGWGKSLIFIVTGQDSPEDRTNAQEADSDGYFVKPVGPKLLDRELGQRFPDTKAEKHVKPDYTLDQQEDKVSGGLGKGVAKLI